MTLPIPEPEVSYETMEVVLDEAAIDHERNESGTLYLTTFAFNLWVSLDTDRKFVRFYSYWPVTQDASDEHLLRFVNACNESLILVQFSLAEDRQRFDGQYIMSYRDGLIRTQFLRMIRLFSEVFHRAVEHEDTEGLLGIKNCETTLSQARAEDGSLH